MEDDTEIINLQLARMNECVEALTDLVDDAPPEPPSTFNPDRFRSTAKTPKEQQNTQ